MMYSNEQVMSAFKIYSILALNGCGNKEDLRLFMADDVIRGLVEQFAKEVECTIFNAGDYIYMVPLLTSSPFHVSNENIKRTYLTSKSVNLDIYMMYVAIIVLFGEFYDSYQTIEATREFLPMNIWLTSLNEKIESLKEHGMEKLREESNEYEYNWASVVEKWDAMDDINEKVKVQDGRTVSRKSFLNMVKQFLESQNLISDIGNDEVELTEKAKVIVQRYYMEVDYNRGILDFMYDMDKKREDKKDAGNI